MKKNISISSQLLIINFALLLIAELAFSVAMIIYISNISITETYDKLMTYGLLSNHEDLDLDKLDYLGLGVDSYKCIDGNIESNFDDYNLSKGDMDLIIEKVTKEKEINKEEYIINDRIMLRNNTYYFSLNTKDDLKSYVIVLTSSDYVRNNVKRIVLSVNLIFLSVILITVFIIYIWSSNLSKRLRRLQKHIISLPKNEYREKYLDIYDDEIGELSLSVERMRKEICENERIKTEMLHNLSHDFKTPISVIKSYTEAMQDGVEDVGVATEKILEQSDILKKKVNRLIQYNKLEYFDDETLFEKVNIKEVINDIVENYKYQLDNIEFVLDVDDNIYFRGIKENWYIIIDNIIDNAKRYAKTQIKIILKPKRLRIYNDGEHLDEKFVNSEFKPYEKGSKGQFGLGMSIVQKTVNSYGMNLYAVNEEVGVSFIIQEDIDNK